MISYDELTLIVLVITSLTVAAAGALFLGASALRPPRRNNRH